MVDETAHQWNLEHVRKYRLPKDGEHVIPPNLKGAIAVLEFNYDESHSEVFCYCWDQNLAEKIVKAMNDKQDYYGA